MKLNEQQKLIEKLNNSQNAGSTDRLDNINDQIKNINYYISTLI